MVVTSSCSLELSFRKSEALILIEACTIFVRGQLRTNSRKLKLEPFQVMHLYNYFQKYRPTFLAYKVAETDKFFLSLGKADMLSNTVTGVLVELSLKKMEDITV